MSETKSASTPPLPEDLLQALERIAFTPVLLVCMDFDGTMAPLTDHAADARALPESAAALAALAHLPATRTALLSGRSLESLRSVAQPNDYTLLVGSHGAESWLGPDAEPLVLDEQRRSALTSAREDLSTIAEGCDGAWLEDKPAGVVLHTRQASREDAAAATEAATAVLTDADGVHVLRGKDVLEASVIKTSKGEGVTTLRSITGATGVLFAGDDVTDEHAFNSLVVGDIGVKVGGGETAAQFRISSPQDVAVLLEQTLQLRQDAVQRPPLDREAIGPSLDE